MSEIVWEVTVIGKAKKPDKNLSKEAMKSFVTLLFEMRKLGPYRTDWPNYTKMKNRTEEYHCHIEKGRPTYVVCWRIASKDKKIIEVYYAGTHEKAPY